MERFIIRGRNKQSKKEENVHVFSFGNHMISVLLCAIMAVEDYALLHFKPNNKSFQHGLNG